MSASSTPPPASNSSAGDKQQAVEVEKIVTHDQVPGHNNYYEKNGLRTYGDGEDHGEHLILSSSL